MIKNDAAIMRHTIEAWDREIIDYAKKYKDNMTSRNVMHVREVGADTAFDNVTSIDRTGPGAQIIAKGTPPSPGGFSVTSKNHEIYQIGWGFKLSEKDMKLDPTAHNRLIDIGLREIHRKEDDITLNGVTNLNITGLIGAAQANTNGTITNGTNAGAWNGSDGTADIYDDINTAMGLMDDEFDSKLLLGKKTDLLYTNRMDSERQPYWKTIAPLFDLKENDRSWMWKSGFFTPGKVYLTPGKDFMAGELVVSENPKIDVLYNGGLSPGKNYEFEISEWVVPEFHNNDAFVEIDIT